MASSQRLCVWQVTKRLGRLVYEREGGIIVVEGEPGMGKTRLLEEIEHESMAQRQSEASDPTELPAIRKRCNIFVANGDLANKSKVAHQPTSHTLALLLNAVLWLYGDDASPCCVCP